MEQSTWTDLTLKGVEKSKGVGGGEACLIFSILISHAPKEENILCFSCALVLAGGGGEGGSYL